MMEISSQTSSASSVMGKTAELVGTDSLIATDLRGVGHSDWPGETSGVVAARLKKLNPRQRYLDCLASLGVNLS
jgi:hypothetical protein